jgi:cytochrome c oxidase accessory protein FixG
VNRKFEFFGIRFWSHDGPLIFFVLGSLTIGLALVTALFGRIWCGWACPQTVFIDAIYRQIEIWIEGNYIERRKLRQSAPSAEKFFKWILKWGAFFLISSVIAHSFVAYFSGAERLVQMMHGSPTENWNYFLLVFVMTVVIAFNFGWFREQFCIVVCPYGRFQSVLLDPNSVTVLYDEVRGEPRKGLVALGEKTGDCVACNRCVQVCPTGIDIRKGIQLECISCTACIDACNEIMEKVKRAPNLIRYASLNIKTKFLRPRVIVYAILFTAFVSGFFINISNRSGVLITLLRAIETPYQVLKHGDESQVINHFRLHIHNQSNLAQSFQLEWPKDWTEKNIHLTLPNNRIDLEPTSEKEIHFFVIFPPQILDKAGIAITEVKVISSKAEDTVTKSLNLLGPVNSGISK